MLDPAAVIGSLSGLIVAVTGLIAVVARLWHRDNVTDRRVDRMWEAHLRRGRTEGEAKSYITDSPEPRQPMPLLLEPSARQAYDPIAPALRALRKKMPGATNGQLAEQIEIMFGPWLARHICKPLGVSDYACLEMARMVATETEKPENGACL